jgi:hypothetical protein
MYPFLGRGEARLRFGNHGLRLGDYKDRPYAGHIQLQSALGIIHFPFLPLLPHHPSIVSNGICAPLACDGQALPLSCDHVE